MRHETRPKLAETHLDDPVSGSSREPLVARLDGTRADPSQVPRDDPRELPRRVVIGLDLSSFPPPDERLREESRLGVRDGDGTAVLGRCCQGLRAGRQMRCGSVRRSTDRAGVCVPELFDRLGHRTYRKGKGGKSVWASLIVTAEVPSPLTLDHSPLRFSCSNARCSWSCWSCRADAALLLRDEGGGEDFGIPVLGVDLARQADFGTARVPVKTI